MELQLSEDQTAFVETTRRFLAAECSIPAVRALESSPDGFDRAVWRRGADLGWTSLLVAEADGGGSLSERGLADLALVAEEMGRCVAPGPLVPVNVVAAAVSAWGRDEVKRAVLPGLLDGSSIAAWCGWEWASQQASVTARATSGSLVLDGPCALVEAGAQADHLLVTFTDGGKAGGESAGGDTAGGVGLAVVPTGAVGMTVTPLAGLDLVRRFAAITFDGVEVDPAWVLDTSTAGGGTGDEAAVERLEDTAVALQCAETVGAMDHVLAMTIEYLGDRYSFGRPLSSYQALKHRIADQKMWLEASHGIATAAIRAVAAGSPDAGELASAAAWWIGPRATELVQDCIQLHGGIGVTWEHNLHLYLRRVTVNRATAGTPEVHAERIATRLLGAAS